MFTEHVQSRTDRREATRENVVSAAFELFTAQGYRTTTVRDIARTAGVSTGTVMAVGTKDALLIRAFDRLIRDRGDTRPRETDPLDRSDGTQDLTLELLAVVDPFIDLFTSRPEIATDFGVALVRSGHEAEVFHELARDLENDFTAVLVRHEVPEDTARGLAGSLYTAYIGALFISVSLAATSRDEVRSRIRVAFEGVTNSWMSRL